MIRANLASGMSMRSCAYNLNLARKTIERKFVYLAKKARMNQKELLMMWAQNPLAEIQFDDLISSIHTKLKPISVSVVVDSKSLKIYIRNTILHNGILAFKNQKRIIKVGDSPSLSYGGEISL